MFLNKTDSKTMHIFIPNSDGDYAGLIIYKYSLKIVTANQYKCLSKVEKRYSPIFDDELNYFLFEFKEE